MNYLYLKNWVRPKVDKNDIFGALDLIHTYLNHGHNWKQRKTPWICCWVSSLENLKNVFTHPYLLFLISGGHTQYLTVKKLGDYKRLGTTIDDALGEAFDKTAKLLNLGYPGGPKIEELAMKGEENRFILPKPILNRGGSNLSFAGLKTAILRLKELLLHS